MTQLLPCETTGIPTGAATFPAAVEALSRLPRDESGQDIVEYALIAFALGLGTVAGVHGLAADVSGYFNTVLRGFSGATGF